MRVHLTCNHLAKTAHCFLTAQLLYPSNVTPKYEFVEPGLAVRHGLGLQLLIEAAAGMNAQRHDIGTAMKRHLFDHRLSRNMDLTLNRSLPFALLNRGSG